MRIVFMGTPEFSVPVLEALVEAGHEVCAVYTQPPRPAGRGKKERLSPVQARAEELGLPTRHPVSLKSEDAQADFAALNADIAVVVAYGLILPQAVLDAPAKGCLNIHASLLPRWRGAAPIHRAIMAGDAETGVCIMQMEAGLDTGPVLLRRATPIGATDTTGALHDRLSAMGAEAIVEASTKIDKAEARVDWTQPAEGIVRQINGLSPFPGAWTLADGARVKLLEAQTAKHALPSGEIQTSADGQLLVGAGQGDDSIDIIRLQREGKKPAITADVLKGWTPPTAFD